MIRYALAQDAWSGYEARLTALATAPGVRRICEVGGGVSPALPLSFVEASGCEYVVLDISAKELAQVPAGYRTCQADIAAAEWAVEGGYDLVFSRMLAEHVADGERFHRNVYELLAHGGVAFHFFPTLYALPFLVNRLIPESVSTGLLRLVQPGRTAAKFPARYDWCCGPTPAQLARLEGLGYEILEYAGFFGHDYFRRWPAVHRCVQAIARRLARHPVPQWTSYAYLVLRKR